jgi:hypothetical protein
MTVAKKITSGAESNSGPVLFLFSLSGGNERDDLVAGRSEELCEGLTSTTTKP